MFKIIDKPHFSLTEVINYDCEIFGGTFYAAKMRVYRARRRNALQTIIINNRPRVTKPVLERYLGLNVLSKDTTTA